MKVCCRLPAFASCKAFLKKQSYLELVSVYHFLHDFWGKIFLLFYSINWPNFIVWLPLLRKILSNMCIVNCFGTKFWRHKFWNYLYISNQAVFSTWPKSQDQKLNIFRTKKDFKMKEKLFFIIFKGLLLKQIK